MSILTLLLVAAPLTADAQALDENAIRANLFGRTLTGEYNSGANWRETFNTDGTTDYSDAGSKAKGTATFGPSATICFRYEGDDRLSGGCFEVWQRGLNCFDFYGTSNTGSTGTSYTQKVRGLGWDARGWDETTERDCTAGLIS